MKKNYAFRFTRFLAGVREIILCRVGYQCREPPDAPRSYFSYRSYLRPATYPDAAIDIQIPGGHGLCEG